MNFTAYAESLPGTVLDQLYQSLYVCQAVLHSLPPLAKQYALRMLHVGPVPVGEQDSLRVFRLSVAVHHVCKAIALLQTG